MRTIRTPRSVWRSGRLSCWQPGWSSPFHWLSFASTIPEGHGNTGGIKGPDSVVSNQLGVWRPMLVKLRKAQDADAVGIAELRSAAAEALTRQFGTGHWSGIATEKGVRRDMRNSRVFVASNKGRLVATLRLTTRKPWAIDRSYFGASAQPLYLLSMAVAPDLQRQGIGRQCVEQIKEICRRWPADAIRLDAYDAPAGAGAFYAKCGFRKMGRVEYRGCPLLYFEWSI
jgi:GNAT superfamily N-acetyltransferase